MSRQSAAAAAAAAIGNVNKHFENYSQLDTLFNGRFPVKIQPTVFALVTPKQSKHLLYDILIFDDRMAYHFLDDLIY